MGDPALVRPNTWRPDARFAPKASPFEKLFRRFVQFDLVLQSWPLTTPKTYCHCAFSPIDSRPDCGGMTSERFVRGVCRFALEVVFTSGCSRAGSGPRVRMSCRDDTSLIW
jgi:hypothetical protein